MQAMILAAGFGTRLRPHTLVRPKPLFPILNKPLLLLTVERLQNMGFNRIVVNCHHLRRQIATALDGIDGVSVQEEEAILGTGGGLRMALESFVDEPLLITNGDIYHTLDYNDLYQFHMMSGASVTLAMHDYSRFNSVQVRDGKIVSFDRGSSSSLLAFTGIHIIDPHILLEIKENCFSSIIDHYSTLLNNGMEIACYRGDHCFWTDIGSPGDYLQLHEGLLKKEIPCWPEAGPLKSSFHIGAKGVVPPDTELTDWACIGDGVLIGDGSHLERSIIWDDISVPAGSRVVDEIVSGYDAKRSHRS